MRPKRRERARTTGLLRRPTRPQCATQAKRREFVGGLPGAPVLVKGTGVERTSGPSARRTSAAARVGLVFFGLLVGVGMLLVAEGLLRLAGVAPARRDPFAGFGDSRPVFERVERKDGMAVWRTAVARGLPHSEEFLADKPADGFRVFVVGESSAAGVPYPATQAFSAWLARRLQGSLPGRPIEVVNAAIPGYASRRVLGVVREVTAYEPDLLIVYAGHNEFAESRQYQHLLEMDPRLFRLRVLLSSTRLYGVLERALGWDAPRQVDFDDIEDAKQMFAVADERLAGTAYPSERERGWGEQHYRWNLEEMARLMQDSGARTVFVSLGQNFSDWAPGASQHRAGLEAAELARWEEQVAAGRGHAVAGDCARALDSFEQAIEIDDQHAQLYFELAVCAERQGERQRAALAYLRASNLDRVPHGAPSSFNDIIQEAAESSNSLFVDGAAALAAGSSRPLPGDDLFVDPMHPNLRANQILAASIADALRQAGLPAPSAEWAEAPQDPPVEEILAADPSLRRQERLVRAASCALARRDACALAELDVVLADEPEHAWARQLREVVARRSSPGEVPGLALKRPPSSTRPPS